MGQTTVGLEKRSGEPQSSYDSLEWHGSGFGSIVPCDLGQQYSRSLGRYIPSPHCG